MALRKQHKEHIAQLELPADKECRQRLERWMAISGRNDADVALAIGYARSTLSLYRNGFYAQFGESNSDALRMKLLRLMDENPVDLVEDLPGRPYTHTRNYRMLREYFFQALDKGRAYHVYGAPGSQKTFVALALLKELAAADAAKNGSARRAYLVRCRPNLHPGDLVKRVAIEVGVTPRGAIDQILRKIRVALLGRRALIIFDEAQSLSRECLEVVRELLDMKPYIGLLFLGSHDLEQRFTAVGMEQWRSRMYAGKPLPGLSVDEAEVIVRGELGSGYSAAKVKALIEGSHEKDFRRLGADKLPLRYISARLLFNSIRRIQEKQADARGGAV